MKIRAATREDFAFVLRMIAELGVEDAPPDAEQFTEMIPELLIAEAGGIPVGYARYRIDPRLGRVMNLVTAPAARRRGVGRALMAEIAARLRAAGCERWALNVKAENTAAIAFYEQLGLRAVERSMLLRTSPELRARLQGEAVARPLQAEEGARLEKELGLRETSLTTGANFIAERDGQRIGVFGFVPKLPGARPFYLDSVADLGALLAAIEPMLPFQSPLYIAAHQPEVIAALRTEGAELRMEVVAMLGALRHG